MINDPVRDALRLTSILDAVGISAARFELHLEAQQYWVCRWGDTRAYGRTATEAVENAWIAGVPWRTPELFTKPKEASDAREETSR